LESKVIVIVGPTCSGKTNLGIQLARALKSEIISADSRQIYYNLDIGTAKPNQNELSEINHYFINELSIEEEFNVSEFEISALKIINKLIKHNKVPIVVGGSGLYVKALIDGIFNVDSDKQIRQELIEKKNIFGKEFLYRELLKTDPVTAAKLLPQNWKRVIRALEVFYITGKPIWQIQAAHKRETNLNFLQFGIQWNRETLYHNIEKRVDVMIKAGLVDEVNRIFKAGKSEEYNSLNTVGYKELFSYLRGEINLEKAIELIKRNTRRFAKRQMTWFRKDKRISWYKTNSQDDFPDLVKNILGHL
jgi:tRNA dimethylallyltransferase